eukprot:76748_1
MGATNTTPDSPESQAFNEEDVNVSPVNVSPPTITNTATVIDPYKISKDPIIRNNSIKNTKIIKIKEMKANINTAIYKTKLEYFTKINYANNRFEFITLTNTQYINTHIKNKPNKLIYGFINDTISSYTIINQYKLQINLQSDQGYYEHTTHISHDLKYLCIWSDKGYIQFINISNLPKCITETPQISQTEITNTDSYKFNMKNWLPTLFNKTIPTGPFPHLKKHKLYRAPMGDTKQFKWFYNSNICANILCCIMDFGDMECRMSFPDSCPRFTIFNPETNEIINTIRYMPPSTQIDRFLAPDYGQNCFVDFSLIHLEIVKYWTYYRELYQREHTFTPWPSGTYHNHNFNYYCIIKNNWTKQQCIKQRPLAINNDMGEIKLLAINDNESVLIEYCKWNRGSNKKQLKFIFVGKLEEIECKNMEQNNKYIGENMVDGGSWNFENKLDAKNEICVALFVKNNNDILLFFTSKPHAPGCDFRGCHQLYVFMNGSSKQKRELLMSMMGNVQNGINSFGIYIVDLMFEYIGWDLVSVFDVNDFMNGLESQHIAYRMYNLPTFYHDRNTNKLCVLSSDEIAVIDLQNMLGCNGNIMPI